MVSGLFKYLGSSVYFILGIILSILSGFFITGPIWMSTNWTFLKAVRKQKVEIMNIFEVFKRNYLNAVLASVLMSIFLFIGFLLLIIPGIVLAVRFGFVHYLIMDKKMKAWQAIKTSWDMTRSCAWTIFFMAVLCIPIVIVGLLLLIVGIIPAVAWIASSYAVLYNSVSAEYKF